MIYIILKFYNFVEYILKLLSKIQSNLSSDFKIMMICEIVSFFLRN